ncbi:hypothetical protein Esti_000446 [Eimeria stiedai]
MRVPQPQHAFRLLHSWGSPVKGDPLKLLSGASGQAGGPASACFYCLRGPPRRLVGVLMLCCVEAETRRQTAAREPLRLWVHREARNRLQQQQQQQKQQQRQQQLGICAASLLRGLTVAAPTMPLELLLRLSWSLPALAGCSCCSCSCSKSNSSNSDDSNSSSGNDSSSSSNGCCCKPKVLGLKELEAKSARPSRTLLFFLTRHNLQQQQQVERGQQQPQQAIWRREKRALADCVLSQLSKHLLSRSPAATTDAAAAAAAHPSATATATAAAAAATSTALLVRGIHGLSRLLPRSKRLTSHGGPPANGGRDRRGPPQPAVRAEVVRALVHRLEQLLGAATGVSGPAGPLAVPSSAAAAAAGPWRVLSLREWGLLLAAHSRLLLPLPLLMRAHLQQTLLQEEASCLHSTFGPPQATAAAAAAAVGSWADGCAVAQSLAKLNEGSLLSLLYARIAACLTRHFAAAAAAAFAVALAGECKPVAEAASEPLFTVCSSSSNSSDSSSSSSSRLVQQAQRLAAQAEDWLSSWSIFWGLRACPPLHAEGGPLSLAGSDAAVSAATAAAAARCQQQRWGPLFAALNALAAADALLAAAATAGGPNCCCWGCELGGPLASSSTRRQAVAAVLAASAAAAADAAPGAAAAAKQAAAARVPLEELLGALPLHTVKHLDEASLESSGSSRLEGEVAACLVGVSVGPEGAPPFTIERAARALCYSVDVKLSASSRCTYTARSQQRLAVPAQPQSTCRPSSWRLRACLAPQSNCNCNCKLLAGVYPASALPPSLPVYRRITCLSLTSPSLSPLLRSA